MSDKTDDVLRLMEEHAAPLRARIAEVEADIENAVWNLGGCDAIASGHAKPHDYDHASSRPALDSVSRLAVRADTLAQQVATLTTERDTAVSDYQDLGQQMAGDAERIATLARTLTEARILMRALLHYSDKNKWMERMKKWLANNSSPSDILRTAAPSTRGGQQ